MLYCNYLTSKGSQCYYERAHDFMQCYFHDKVRRNLITGYYVTLVSEEQERVSSNDWVSLR